MARRDFYQQTWNDLLQEDCRELIRLAVREDLEREHDWTTVSLVPSHANAQAEIVARESGVICGMEVAKLIISELNLRINCDCFQADGVSVTAKTVVATLSGSARDLLTAERIILNFMGRLSGIATLTQRYVKAIAHTTARVYDTRKTTPGWRRLEKYAVYCGGGRNHRAGLYEAILIKDNHLAFGSQDAHYSPADAVLRAKEFASIMQASGELNHDLMIEIELDSLIHFDAVLATQPDIILLDNMSCEQLKTAVVQRNAIHSNTELEASGGVKIDTIATIAETGIERISCGALTHSAINFDLALDWKTV
jgi:nicotinate-nucleotide pyrophosphorylase (carboxylating)